MGHGFRGPFILIDNRTFTPESGIIIKERLGVDWDAANLSADFARLGFRVVYKRDQTANSMLKCLTSGK